MYIILETKTEQVKNPNTKTTYNVESVETRMLTKKEYQLTTCEDTLKWFRRLGGTETTQKTYTCMGYNVHRLISTSPDKQIRRVRDYQFYYLNYKEIAVYNSLFKEFKGGLFWLKRYKQGKNLNQMIEIIRDKLIIS